MTDNEKLEYIAVMISAIRVLNRRTDGKSYWREIDHFTTCAILIYEANDKFIKNNYQQFDNAIVDAKKLANQE